MLPDEAVTVAVVALVTEATFAVKEADVDAAGTVTEAGTETEELLVEIATLTPPEGAEPERLTWHESASDPVMDVLPHETALTVGATVVPVPLRLMAWVGVVLESVSCPVTELADVGSN